MTKQLKSARIRIGGLSLLTVLALVLSACGGGETIESTAPSSDTTTTTVTDGESTTTDGESTTTVGDVITLRMAHDLPQDSAYHVGALAFAESASEMSGGRIEIEVFPDAQLGDARAMLDGMQTGSVDIAPLGTGFMSGVIPEIQFVDLPFLWDNASHAYGVLDGDQVSQIMEPLFQNQGLVQLAWWELGWRQLTNNVRSVTVPEDLEGIKLRVPESPLYLAAWETTPANVTPLDFAELYNALEQGVVDGQENPLNLINSVRFYEVQDFLTLTNHAYSAAALVISQETWDALDADLQGALLMAAEASSDAQRNAASGADDEYLQTITDFGVDVTQLDAAGTMAFRELMSEAWTIYLDSVGAVGQDLLDAVEDGR